MQSRWFSQRLWWALLVSLLIHLLLVGRLPSWTWNDVPAPHVPIRVALQKPPPPEPVPPAKQPRPGQELEKPVSPKPQPVSGTADDSPIQPVPMPEDVPLEPIASPTPEPLPELLVPEEIVTDSATEAAVPVEQGMPDEEPAPAPPVHVELDFDVIRKGGVAAVEKQTFHLLDNGEYRLESLAQPKGLLALALSDLHQLSEGHVTEAGLVPERYLYQYGKDTSRARKATFDWGAGELLMETGKRRKTAALQAGAQDLLSFMYQFMYVPPLQEMQLAITNGRHFRVYAYVFEGAETLETRAGALQCYKISRSDLDDNESLELWLATERHYLPVRIRMTDEDGVVTDRIVTRLQLE